MSWLTAGIMVGGSVLSAGSANKADREANALEKYQDLIDVERLKGDVAVQEQNMRNDLASLESSQVAMSSAMGKRSTGGSIERIQEVGRSDMEENIARSDSELERAKKFGKVSASAKDRATDSRTSTRNIGATTKGLLSLSKAFA